jgi:hypothetical protein
MMAYLIFFGQQLIERSHKISGTETHCRGSSSKLGTAHQHYRHFQVTFITQHFSDLLYAWSMVTA